MSVLDFAQDLSGFMAVSGVLQVGNTVDTFKFSAIKQTASGLNELNSHPYQLSNSSNFCYMHPIQFTLEDVKFIDVDNLSKSPLFIPKLMSLMQAKQSIMPHIITLSIGYTGSVLLSSWQGVQVKGTTTLTLTFEESNLIKPSPQDALQGNVGAPKDVLSGIDLSGL